MTHRTSSRSIRRGDGTKRFFADQAYHFQTIRALDAIPAGGADTAEVLQTIGNIRTGDAQSWHAAWSATADRAARLAAETKDKTSAGLALLRAHSYYRTAAVSIANWAPSPCGRRTSLTG